MIDCVEQMIQADNSPNLYWALATLPQPLIDIRDALQFEMDVLPRAIKALSEAEVDCDGAEHWKAACQNTLADLASLAGDGIACTTALNALLKDNAKPIRERLVAGGMDAGKVALMPSERVVLLDSLLEMRRLSQHAIKGTFLPAHLAQAVATPQVQDVDDYLSENKENSGAAVIMGLLFPSVGTFQNAFHRQSFVMNRLMTIEALRMHAAEHDGKLPETLAELSPVQALPNPFTNSDFDYQVATEGGIQIVTLSGVTPATISAIRTIKIRFNTENDD